MLKLSEEGGNCENSIGGVIGASKIGLTSVSVIGLAKFGGEELKANVMPARARVNYQWLISDQKDGPYRNIVGAVKKRLIK